MFRAIRINSSGLLSGTPFFVTDMRRLRKPGPYDLCAIVSGVVAERFGDIFRHRVVVDRDEDLERNACHQRLMRCLPVEFVELRLVLQNDRHAKAIAGRDRNL